MEYEERTLFSANPAGGDALLQAAADGSQNTADSSTVAAADESGSTTAQSDQATTTNDQSTQTADSGGSMSTDEQAVRRELVIIDGSIADAQTLIDDLTANADDGRRFELVVLQEGDGIEEITELLSQYHDLSAVHFVTHAADGTLKLGDTWLDLTNLPSYSEQITLWKAALTDDADLLFYGCELAATTEGRALLTEIESLTGADVAASTDNTGTALFGGNWNFEYTAGGIESTVAFSAAARQQYMNLLNVAVDSASSIGGNNLATITLSHTVSGTNRLLLVAISFDPHGDTVNSVTHNGTSLTFVGTADAGAHSRVELWSMIAPVTGTHDVVVNMSGTNSNGVVVGAISFTGVDQTTPLPNFASNTGSSPSASVSVTSQAGETVFAAVHNHGTSGINPGVGQTEYWDVIDENSNGGGSVKAGAATVSNTWTVANDDWTAVGVSIRSSNIAPVLDSTASPVLNSVTEDAGAPSVAVGTLVSSLVDFASPAGQLDNVTDADSGAVLGIAVTAADSSNGTWWYSTDNGSNWSALGSVSDGNARLLAADSNTRIYFQPTANYNGTIAAAITFRAWDQTSGTNGGLADTSTNGGVTAFSSATDTAGITVTSVNDAPVNTAPGAQSTNEDATLVFSGGNGNQISIADVDAGSSTVQVTLTGTNGTITLGGTTGLSFSTGDGTADATMTFTGTITDINTALNGLSFAPTANFSGAAQLQIVTNDLGNSGSGGAQSDTDNIAITVNAVNDAPVNTVPGPQSTNEDTALVFSSGNGNQISIADTDAGSSNVRVTLTATNGTITLNGITGLSFSTGDGTADAVMTFTGTITDINAALDGLSFTPTANFNGAAQLQIVTNDLGNSGSGGALSDTDAVAITVDAVNDAPVNTVPGPQSTNEDTALVFSSGNGNQISIADLDAGSSTVQVTLTATNGTLTLNGTTGLTFSIGDGTADGTMAFSGTIADINSALDGLSFAPTADFNGAAQLQIVTNDLGNSGSGGALTDTDTVAITVDAVNDAPVLTLPGAQATPFQASVVFSTSNGNAVSINDVDAGSATIEATLGVLHGTLTLSQSTGLTFLAGDGSNDASMVLRGSLADINAALAGMTYTPTSTYRGPDTLSLSVDDLGNTGASGPMLTADTVDINVAPASQRILLSAPNEQPATDFDALFSAATGNAIVFTDVYSENPVLTVTISAAHGTFSLGGTSGLTFISGGPSAAAMSFTGTLSNVNAALDGSTFHGTSSSGSLYISASDPSRDATASHTAGTTVDVLQPPVYPSATPSPTADGTGDDSDDSGNMVDDYAVPFVAPTARDAHDLEMPRSVLRSNQSNVLAAPLTNTDSEQKDDVESQKEADVKLASVDLERIAFRGLLDDQSTRTTTHAGMQSLDSIIPWSLVVFDEQTGDEPLSDQSLIAGTAGVTAALSVGYALWSIRAASLLSTLVSSMPAWQTFDPLPVIEFTGRPKDDHHDDEGDAEDDMFGSEHE